MASRTRSHNQLDLFASQAPESLPSMVRSVPVEPDLVDVARRLPSTLRLGTSSWTFPGWEGIVYSGAMSESQLARHGLAAYAQHPLLRAVGVDRTYYAPIAAADFAAYAAVVPEDFRFLVKAHARCTHVYASQQHGARGQRRELNSSFLDAAYATEQVIGPCMEGLGARLGVLLFQFPPQDVRELGGASGFAERLQVFLSALPQGPLYAVEVRNADLLTTAYAQALDEAGVSHCYNVHPRMPALTRQARMVPWVQSPALVVRWMLHPRLGYDEARLRYEPFDRLVDADPDSRAAIATMCLDTVARGRLAYVIANNKAEGSSPLTLFRLAEHLVTRLPASEMSLV